jgi:hypothetical protein
MDIDKAIRIFLDFLNKSWEIIIPLKKDSRLLLEDLCEAIEKAKRKLLYET